MGQHVRCESYPSSTSSRLNYLHHQGSRRLDHLIVEADDLPWPFKKIVSFDDNEIRETAYEIFFTSCRSSPGFGGRHALTFHSNNENNVGNGNGNGNGNGDGNGGKLNQVVTKPISRVKKALGLKMLKTSPSKRMTSGIGSSGVASTPAAGASGNPFSYTLPPLRPRRPMTSAEIMRQQMRVIEHNDNKLRKTLMRTLVGQMGKRSEANQTVIIPLELLRHLKPAEFSDSQEYHMWQKRQLKVLEAGLLLYPSIPLEENNSFATRLRDIISNAESKPIDTSKNSDTMRTLCNSVVSLSWRSTNGTPTDVCHWADGFPFNMHLYTSLLQSVFDIRDDTLVLDEVDELFELMQKTWSTLGITLPIHHVCFTWVLFHQYIATGQVEPDLLFASHVMLNEVANDAKKEKDSSYIKILSSVLNSMQGWVEKRLLNYHEYFQRGNANEIENLLCLVLTVSKILGEDHKITDGEITVKGDITIVGSYSDRVDKYIRSSIKNEFEKVVKAVNAKSSEYEGKKEFSKVMMQLVQETEDLVMKERQHYSPILKKWHSSAGAVAAVTLHKCYGQVLRQYTSEMTSLTSESVQALQRAEKLEKVIVKIAVEDSSECDDGGKKIVREMVPFDVDSVMLRLLVKWIDESLSKVKECVQRAKETETWNPKSKSEQFAPSAAELMKLAVTTVEECFQVPIAITEDLVQVLADGLEILFQNYIMFVATCGSKQSYIPVLPSLTRCNSDSKFIKLWKKAAPCSSGCQEQQCTKVIQEGHHHHHKQSTSRGTQRLYVRLNTLHYLLTHIHSLEKTFYLNPKVVPSNRIRFAKKRRDKSKTSSYFESANLCTVAACQHVSEIAAHRLVFHDLRSVLYDNLYVGGVGRGHIKPVLRILNHNISLLTTILTEKAQSLILKEVMKATFNSFLMVLLAGGSSRLFVRSDHEIIREDFELLRRIFSNCVEGLIADNVVEGEAALVDEVIALMSRSTEKLMEDFSSIVTCELGSRIGILGNGQNLPMPVTTGNWNRSDPNTILRVLCYRNDRVANQFLKRTFQLAKRR